MNDLTVVETNPSPASDERSPAFIRVESTRNSCNVAEAAFAEHWATCGNKAKAYRMMMRHDGSKPSGNHYERAVLYSNKPNVRAYFNALRDLACERAVVSVQRILEHDQRIVDASENDSNELSRHVWVNCRYCHGAEGEYQWIDIKEFTKAFANWSVNPDAKDAKTLVRISQPTNTGGYGFNPWGDPNPACSKCLGLGDQHTIIGDTTKLEGPAAALYKGVKRKADGSIEVLTHDVEKAKERLLKAAGVFRDSAADVARGAVAGAIAGVAAASAGAATRTASVAESMTDEQAARAYLELAG